MARNIIINTGTTSQSEGISLNFEVSIKSQDTINNKTILSWRVVGTGRTGGYWVEGYNTKAYINGVNVLSVKKQSIYNGTVLGSGEFTANHNNDGTKSVQLKIESSFYYNSSPNVSKIGTFVIDKIPRQSKIKSVRGNVLGQTTTIEIEKYVSSYTNSLWYKVGDSKNWYTIAEYSSDTSFQANLRRDLASEFPNSDRGLITYMLVTYNQSREKIGTTVYWRDTVYVQSSTTPNFTIYHTDGKSNIKNKFGFYVQSKSSLKININASGVYGSSIKNIVTEVDGQKYNGSSFITNTINKSGNISIKTTITDSRGRKETKTTTAYFNSYTPPKINNFNAQRSNSSGNIDATGVYAKIIASGSITSLNNKNNKSFSLSYREKNSSNWTNLYNSSSSYSVNYSQTHTGFSEDKSYEVKFDVTDYFSTTSKTIIINTSFFAITWFTDGKKGIGIGMVAKNQGYIETGLPILMEGKELVPKKDYFVNVKSRYDNPDYFNEFWTLSSHSSLPSGSEFWYINTIKHLDNPVSRKQIAYEYNGDKVYTRRRFQGGSWTSWKEIGGGEGVVEIKTQTYSYSSSTSNFSSVSSIELKKYGNVVFISFTVKNLPIGFNKLFSVPYAIRPTGLTSGMATCTNSIAPNGIAFPFIESNGWVSLVIKDRRLGSSDNMKVTFSYVI